MNSENNIAPGLDGGSVQTNVNYYSHPATQYMPYIDPKLIPPDVNPNPYCFLGPVPNPVNIPVIPYFDSFLPPDAFKKCHLHTKPRLTCKYCRKYKSALVTSKLLQHQARLTQQQETLRTMNHPASVFEPNESWAAIEMTNITTFNVNNLLRENILSSEYYKSLYDMKNYLEIVNEICNYADHAEPYCAGSSRAPSTLFCCLYKLFTLRLKQHEIQNLLDFSESSYVRCAGFLYLRYVLSLDKLWEWFCPYFLDDDSFSPGTDKQKLTTIGEYAERLMTDDRYFSTVLPRIPVKLKSHYGAQLMPLPAHRKQKALNKANIDHFKPGVIVAACVNGEWVEGTLVSVEDPTSGQAACQVQIEDEDDHIELVDLGLVIILTAKIRKLKRHQERQNRQFTLGRPPLVKRQKNHKSSHESASHQNSSTREPALQRSRHKGRSYNVYDSPSHHQNRSCSRSRSRSIDKCKRLKDRRSTSRDNNTRREVSPRSRRIRERSNSPIELSGLTEQDMLKEFKRREQAKALASGKDYARRPTSYKSSLSLRFSGTTAKPSRGLSPPVKTIHKPPAEEPKHVVTTPTQSVQEPSQEYQERMAQLMRKYNK